MPIDTRKMNKMAEIGIGEVCPTDCTLYISFKGRTKEFLIESPSWREISRILDSIRDLMTRDTSEDEVRGGD